MNSRFRSSRMIYDRFIFSVELEYWLDLATYSIFSHKRAMNVIYYCRELCIPSGTGPTGNIQNLTREPRNPESDKNRIEHDG